MQRRMQAPSHLPGCRHSAGSMHSSRPTHLVRAGGLAGQGDAAGVGALVNLDGGACSGQGRGGVRGSSRHERAFSTLRQSAQASLLSLWGSPSWPAVAHTRRARTGDALQLLDGVPLAADDAAHDALGAAHHMRLADALLQGAGGGGEAGKLEARGGPQRPACLLLHAEAACRRRRA